MYSHSRLETFEQCPQKYQLRYIRNLRLPGEGIEAFMGKRVHEALEKLYKELKFTKKLSLDEVLAFYEAEWEKSWHADVRIVRTQFNPGHYFDLGKRCITDYYRRFDPFDQTRTLGLEERIEMKLADGAKAYSVQGYIDRLAWDPASETYEIHDYKTGSSVPTQDDADQDRQLALYHFGLLQRWPDAKKVKLIWHYLAADMHISSERTLENLRALERRVVDIIHDIEAESAEGLWSPKVSALCEWCEYKSICPAWKHTLAVQVLPPNAYAADSGVQLVQKYAALEAQKADLQAAAKKIETEQAQIAEAAVAYAQKEGLTVLDGPEHRLVIRTEAEFKAPRKTDDPLAWELLRTTLKNAGKLEDVSTVNGNMLKFAIKKGKWPPDVVKTVEELCLNEARISVSLLKKS